MFDPARALGHVALGALVVLAGGFLLARWLEHRRLRWTWALLGFPSCTVVLHGDIAWMATGWGLSGLAAALGFAWHRRALDIGADFAQQAHARVGPLALISCSAAWRRARRSDWVIDGRLVIGQEARGGPVSIPAGHGTHALIVGATGSGKTVTQAWIASRLIEHGHGAVVVDPKGDEALRSALEVAAAARGVTFTQWSPEGPVAYNPYASGSASEIADKALAGEVFTEPHYLRQAQRYLRHAVAALQASNRAVSPASLMASLGPHELERAARQLPEDQAAALLSYLDSLSDRQARELAGVRDRLSILAESDIAPWLADTAPGGAIDLRSAVNTRAVVYFRLDADRRPLIAAMLGAAIVSDLVTLVGSLNRAPVPTVVLIDEFAALGAEQVARLFGRARSAAVSLVLATQELADLKTGRDSKLRDQVLGNVETLIAHRQNVPESAELVAEIAGTEIVWVNTEQTDVGIAGSRIAGRGSRHRGHEFEIHPSEIKRLPRGSAAIVAPGSGQAPVVAHILHRGTR